ncbi:uncharacterized membrane protein YcaP (DUF421 family) [Anaerosolibacter carboniphilus]|uniref:Uncharacterized membrane protein YcaP (DUF421 family) n=1 Tax=Anaerosolibacter carboniphilus TaxID=1417629 RepID=A0A841L3J3_9FIRM|nr:YetF domain-containing protein [Anaerosolibacter carboniphilus]MBB6218740.1 uncharacterized membrane protein YcaP (DUF421 family) [Anaerosolibacter carboniphilus]
MAHSFKVIIIFFIILFLFRILGKRAIGQLTNYDLANLFILSALASGPLVTESLGLALAGIGIFIGLHLLIKLLGTNHRMQEYIQGKSKMLIHRGKISEENLKSARISLGELIDELKRLGYTNVADVEFAILENTGQMMVVPKKKGEASMVKKVSAERKGREIALPLIIHQKIIQENLDYAGLQMDWLMDVLKEKGINSIEEVALVTMNEEEQVYIERIKE